MPSVKQSARSSLQVVTQYGGPGGVWLSRAMGRALLAALAALVSPRTVGGADVVVQHLFLGGDGLTADDPNGTTFEASGLVTVKGVVVAFAAMGCPGTAKHSSSAPPLPSARHSCTYPGPHPAQDNLRRADLQLRHRGDRAASLDIERKELGAAPAHQHQRGFDVGHERRSGAGGGRRDRHPLCGLGAQDLASAAIAAARDARGPRLRGRLGGQVHRYRSASAPPTGSRTFLCLGSHFSPRV